LPGREEMRGLVAEKARRPTSTARLGVALAFLLLTCVGHVRECDGQDAPFPNLSDYVHASLRQWDVPGVALAAIKDGQIVLTRGYGIRTVGESAAVDDQTLFAIASNTKQMTATLLARFVDQGRLNWNDSVKNYLPDLELFDPYVTRELTIRDLLCHRNGLPDYGGDIAWWGSTYDRTEVLRRLRHVRPTSSFRSRWAYQNTMFIAAGEIAAKISGESWDSTIQKQLFQPIGMTSTKTSIHQLTGETNVATPHIRLDSRVQTIPWRSLDNGGPAASVISNARDMAAWMRWLLNDTQIDGKSLVSAKSLRELWSPQMVMPVTDRDHDVYGSQFRAYGLGWEMRDYHGLKVLMHGGWADGMYSFTAIVPERKAGVAVLTNLHNRDLSVSLGYRLLDQCLGLPPRDWAAENWKRLVERENDQIQEFRKLESQRHLGTQPSLALAEFAGHYLNDLYGTVEVVNHNNQLQLKLTASPTYVADLVHWHHDTFRAIWRDPVAETSFITFSLNARGTVAEVKFRMSDFIDPSEYVYRRSPR